MNRPTYTSEPAAPHELNTDPHIGKIAEAKGITTHAALREAIVEWLKKNANTA